MCAIPTHKKLKTFAKRHVFKPENRKRFTRFPDEKMHYCKDTQKFDKLNVIPITVAKYLTM
jgi:hypothetical protein